MNTLYLASQSASRKALLAKIGIPFVVIGQNADELQCNWGLPLVQLVQEIAISKMQHVQMPVGIFGQVCFVVSADTLLQDAQGVVHGKPVDRADAIEKIKAFRAGGVGSTAFCLDRKSFDGTQWHIQERIVKTVSSAFVMDIPDAYLDQYFQETPEYIGCAGGLKGEGYSAQFIKTIDGSYSALMGLPLFELREALTALGFYSK